MRICDQLSAHPLEWMDRLVLLSLILSITIAVEGQPQTTGVPTEISYCANLESQWVNPLPCRSPPRVSESCLTSTQAGLVCAQNGICVGTSQNGPYACQLCDGASTSRGDVGLTLSTFYDGQCRLGTFAAQEAQLYRLSVLPWYTATHPDTKVPTTFLFMNDTDTLRRRIFTNRNGATNPLFTNDLAVRILDWSSTSNTLGLIGGVRPSFDLTIGVGIQLHASFPLAANARNFPLSSVLLQQWGTRRPLNWQTKRFPEAVRQSWYRLNQSHFLVLNYNSTRPLPAALDLRREYSAFPVVATDLGSSPGLVGSSSTIAAASAAQPLDNPFVGDTSQATRDSAIRLQGEVLEEVGVSGTDRKRRFLALDLYSNTLIAGSNRGHGLLYGKPQLAGHVDFVTSLVPVRVLRTATAKTVRNPIVRLVEIAGIALLVYRQSGPVTVAPVYYDPRVEPVPEVRLPDLTNLSSTGFNFPTRQIIYNNIVNLVNNWPNLRVVQYSNRTILYQPGSNVCRFIGNNSLGEFGVGSGSVASFFTADADFTLQGITSGDVVDSIAMGLNHTVVLGRSGTAYIAGDTTYSLADCNPTSSARTTFTPITNFSDPVNAVAAGEDFTVLLGGGNSFVMVCGGAGYMTPAAAPIFNISNSWGSGRKYSAMCTGRFHVCVGSPGDLAREGRFKEVRCYGATDDQLSTNADVASSTPTLNTAFGEDNGVSSSFTRAKDFPYLVNGVESFSCGSHHTVFTQLERFNPFSVRTDLFPNYTSVFTLGSNSRGQLGASLRIPRVIGGPVYPVAPFDERIWSPRAPNRWLYQNNQNSLTGLSFDGQYPLFDLVGAYALGNSTIVHLAPRLFNTLWHFRNNVTRLTGAEPPDTASFSLPTFFFDIVRDIAGDAAVQATLPSGWEDWNVSFRLIQGIPLFLVSNQTTSAGWVGYVDIADMTQPPGSLTRQEVTGAAGSFYRNWLLLARNVTTPAVDGRRKDFQVTVQVPQIFFITNTGETFPKAQLSTGCSQGLSFQIWCDEKTKRVVWGHPLLGSVPSGYRHVIDQTTTTWIAMYVGSPVVFNVTVLNVTVVSPIDVERALAQNRTRFSTYWNPASSSNYFCDPSLNTNHCSSAVFFEPFQRTADSAARIAFNPFLKDSTFSTVPRLTQTSPFGAFYNGIAGRTTSFFNTTTNRVEGLTALELYGVQYNQDSFANSANGFDVVCISIVVLNRTYLVRLRNDGSIVRCQAPTIIGGNNTAPSIASTATWRVFLENTLTIVNLDPGAHPTFGSATQQQGIFFDPNNITFSLSCCSGVALNASYPLINSTAPLGFRFDYKAYIYFVNTSMLQRAMLQVERNSTQDPVDVMDSSRFEMNPLSCDGGFVLPVVPVVNRWNSLQFFTSTNRSWNATDNLDLLIVEVLCAGLNDPRRVRFQFSRDGVNISMPNWKPFDIQRINSTDASLYAVNLSSETILPTLVGDWWNLTVFRTLDLTSKFYCIRRWWVPQQWHKVLIRYSTATNRTEVYWNNDLICQGALLTGGVHNVNTNGIFFGLRSSGRRIRQDFLIREVILCDQNTSSNPNAVFPCRYGFKQYDVVGNSTSQTMTMTLSGTLAPTDTLTITDTMTTSLSVSRTASTSQSMSLTTTMGTLSLSPSFSTSLTYTTSLSMTPTLVFTESKTHSIRRDPWIEMDSFDVTVLTAQNIRKSGVQLVLRMGDGEFDIRQDWANNCDQFFDFTSSLSLEFSPNGFLASLPRSSFLHCKMSDLNRSVLFFNLGKDDTYNSYQDETITLTLKVEGSGSRIRARGVLSFTITGRGDPIDDNLRALEASNGIASLLAAAVGGWPSATLHAATLSLIVNFRCFNNEITPMSYLMHPGRISVNGSPKMGAFVVNLVSIVTIPLCFALVAVIIFFQRKTSWRKAQGHVFFPGLPIVLCAILLPGFLHGAWQYAVDAGTLGSFAAAGLSTVFLTVAPLIYFLSKLYDDANFCADFVAVDQEAFRSWRQQNFFWSLFTVPGRWIPTDRDFAFTKRFSFCFLLFTPRRKYWMCVEMFEAMVFGITVSIVNSNPIVCLTQLAAMFALRLAHLIAVAKFHPAATEFVHYFMVLLLALQTLVTGIMLFNVSQSETRLMQTVIYFGDTACTALLMCASLLTFGVKLRSHYFTWRAITQVAEGSNGVAPAPPLIEDDGRLDPLLLKRALRDEMELPLLASVPKAMDKYESPAFMDGQVTVPMNEEIPDHSVDPQESQHDGSATGSVPNTSFLYGKSFAAAPGGYRPVLNCHIDLESEKSGNEPHADLSAEGQGDQQRSFSQSQTSPHVSNHSLSASPRPKRDPTEVPKDRNVWRLLALEEANDRAGNPIPYDPFYDDDLL